MYLFNGETERETEHRDVTKTGWPPYWGRI